jgi:hypothetical protein
MKIPPRKIEIVRVNYSSLPEYRGGMKLVALVIASGMVTAIVILWILNKI